MNSIRKAKPWRSSRPTLIPRKVRRHHKQTREEKNAADRARYWADVEARRKRLRDRRAASGEQGRKDARSYYVKNAEHLRQYANAKGRAKRAAMTETQLEAERSRQRAYYRLRQSPDYKPRNYQKHQ